MSENKNKTSWKHKLHEILYEADTPYGKIFNIALFIVIIASIIFVMLESIESVDLKYHKFLDTAEWVITILFTLEYIARIITVKKPLKYVLSFIGIIDLLSTIPKYLSLIRNPSHDMSPEKRLIFQQYYTVQIDITRRFD